MFQCFNRRWKRGRGGGGEEGVRKSYLGLAEIVAFQAGILVKAITLTHSDMLYQLEIPTFYFYEPWLFHIFVPLNFLKAEAFPCLLSLLQSTTTEIYIYVFQILFSLK